MGREAKIKKNEEDIQWVQDWPEGKTTKVLGALKCPALFDFVCAAELGITLFGGLK